jgi:hypothetical protein
VSNDKKTKLPTLREASRIGKPVTVKFEGMADRDRARWSSQRNVCKGPGSTPGTIRICPRDPVTGECKGDGCYEIPDPDFNKA